MREGGRTPWFWRVAPVRFLLAAFPLWYAYDVLTSSSSRALRLVVALVAAVTIASPSYGLQAVALLTPFGRASINGSEAIVVSFLGMWLLRASRDRPGPQPPVLIFVAAVAFVAFVNHTPSTIAFVIEGLLLTGAVFYVFRQRPALAVSLPAALAVGAAGAAAFSLSRWTAWRQMPFDDEARAIAWVATACASLAVASRTRGWPRIAALAIAATIEGGVWWNARHHPAGVDLGFASWMTVAIAAGLIQSARMNATSAERL